MKSNKIKWLGTLAALLLAFIPQVRAQEVDDLQEYLDQLAAQQADNQQARSQIRRPGQAQSIEIPVGITEVDLSKFTSYKNRKKTLSVKTSVKFTNGTINAVSGYSGGTCLLKVYGGATVVLDATAGVNAGATSSTDCIAAVGIYEGSTFYECGDITAPNNGSGIAIYIDGASDTFAYVSGTLKGTISNKNNGTVIGMERGGWYKLISKKMTLNTSSQGEYMLLRSDGYLDWNNKGDGNLTIAVYIDPSDDNTLRFYDYANNFQKIIYMEGSTVQIKAENGITRTFTIIEGNYELEELKAQLTTIATQINTIDSDIAEFQLVLDKIGNYMSSDELNTLVDALSQLKAAASALKANCTQLQSAASQPDIDLIVLRTSIVSLQQNVNSLAAELNSLKENTKSQFANYVQEKLTATIAQFNATQKDIANNKARLDQIENQIGTGFFMFVPTDEFSAMLLQAREATANDAVTAERVVSQFNNLFNGVTISSIEQALDLYQNIMDMKGALIGLGGNVANHKEAINLAETTLRTLNVNFPDEDEAFTIRPTSLNKELQLGYKSNRGFVMTSAGMMWFEQKKGADFYLTDAEGNYIVASSGSTALRAGTKEEATAWTGQSIGNGNYIFYSKTTKRYLGYSGINVNNAIIASTSAYSWTINESELDDLQAFLNLLAEEEETSGGGSSDLTEKDTLDYVLPFFDPEEPVTPTNPFVFPKVPYPVHIIVPTDGYWPIPRPAPGKPTPKNFHPIHIPKGSHAIIDASTFRDIVGGDHIIYVEGTLEININVYVYITNWDWFIHVGPGGRVIWRPQPGTGDWPRIKNEGTMDIEEGGLDLVENTGTINHKTGTINWLVNRNIYYFTGGIINTLNNYGQHYHQGGNVITARNFSGGTYTMTGGTIKNTVVNETDTVFINRGTFHFRGGIIGGYGRNLIYHGPGAVMRIDGGRFDFSYVKHYWIEAHSDYYIRGDYDYKPTVPVLLAPSVTIRILYNWIFKFNIVFIGGRPTPRHTLFWGDGFTFNRNFFKYIGWDLPNKRWRWYVNEVQNTIEPRDEEVEDEDDLQAYLDWLAENQDGESASSEEKPQELDLSGKQIPLTKTVTIPTNAHLRFVNCVFRPSGVWNSENVFVIPSGSSVRYEKVFFDFSSSGSYWTGSNYRQVNIFDITGKVWLDAGCRLKGFVNPQAEPTDNYVPGTVIKVNPATGDLWLNSRDIENVIFYVNNVLNAWFTTSLSGKLWFYIPEAYLKEGFKLLTSSDDYRFTVDDVRKMRVLGAQQWHVELDKQESAVLYDFFSRYDMNNDYKVNGTDIQTIINFIVEGEYVEKADINKDDRVNGTDIQEEINIIVEGE